MDGWTGRNELWGYGGLARAFWGWKEAMLLCGSLWGGFFVDELAVG